MVCGQGDLNSPYQFTIMLTLTELTHQQIINTRLTRLYGNHVGCDKARFRVIFATSETIRRHGEFEDYIEGTEIYLRTVKETRTVKKYPHLENRWIIERLIPNFYSDTEGEKGTNYFYECLYAFPEGLPLSWRAIDFFIAHIFRRVKGQDDTKLRLPKNEKEMEYQRLEERKKRRQEIIDSIDSTPLQVMLHDRSAVSLAGVEIEKKG